MVSAQQELRHCATRLRKLPLQFNRHLSHDKYSNIQLLFVFLFTNIMKLAVLKGRYYYKKQHRKKYQPIPKAQKYYTGRLSQLSWYYLSSSIKMGDGAIIS